MATETIYRFRKVEEWKTALMLLPDSLFFDLMRSIFGNIKTPFNKQRLVEDLSVFLSRDDIRNTIASYLDEEDLKIIAAVALLDNPSPEELEEFFQGSMNLAILRSFLNNLEERLILYRFKDEAQSIRRFALNPALESILAPLAGEWGILFPSEADPSAEMSDLLGENDAIKTMADNSEKFTVSDDRMLAALFAFISAEDEFYRAPGIRKKVVDQSKRIFPNINLEAVSACLRQLGLFTLRGERLIPVEKKIRDFGDLSSRARREYWAAGYYLNFIEEKNKNADVSGIPGFFRGRVQYFAALIHRICKTLVPERQYPGIYFHRCLLLMERKGNRNLLNWQEKTDFRTLFIAMETAGIIKRSSNENPSTVFWKIVPLRDQEDSGPGIAMDSTFSFILYPGISLADALSLAAFSSVKEESPFSFELSRASVIRGFDQGISAQTMIKLLKDFSGNRIDENLEWTINDWESRYDAVSLHEGLLLSLSEERQYLAKTRPISSLIGKTLGPGLYLLSGERQQIIAALQKAGVDIIAQPNLQQTEFETRRSFPPPEYIGIELADFGNGSSASFSSSSKTVQENFRQHLMKLNLPKTEKDELLARIERRVILTNNQLEKASIKYEKLEAKGVDYQGKTNIAKQAIADGSLVEVTWPNPETGMSTDIGYAQALEKKEGENVLVLKCDSDILRIPLGKISLLKRLKNSIFGG